MEKEFCTYTQAIALKELGFDEPCVCLYDEDVYLFSVREQDDIYDYWTPAPSYSQVFRWFREKHKLHSTITSISQESWQWHITKPGESLGKLYDEDFYTYEEAESACLYKLIEICKNK